MKQAMTIGELTAALLRKDQTASIRFDFVHMKPDLNCGSYRGDYSQFSIGYCSGGDPKVAQVVAMLQQADGETYTGYKGGEFTMTANSPVFVANSGESGGTAVTDVRDDDWIITLETGNVER